MSRQVRKRIYIQPHQERMLKRLVKKTGLRGAEIVRRALEEHFRTLEAEEARRDAWERVDAVIHSLMAQGPVAGGRTWRREELYEPAG